MGHTNHDPSIHELPARIRPALVALLEAVEYAEQTSGDYWEFAIELDRLEAMGLTLNDFRWLVRNELIEHQREVTLEADDGRAFRPSGDLTFPDRTCFVLTDKGMAFSRLACGNATSNNTIRIDCGIGNGSARNSGGALPSRERPFSDQLRPRWDPERRLLRVNGTPVKHFKWSAQNQEAILSAFEEEGWPSRIDDPLPPHEDQDSKRRLSDTIKCLNRKQDNPILHFRGDGTGEGIVWEFVDGHDST